jgi:hypothetical protein
MGPQLGYYYPEIVMQGDLHGGRIDARGIIAPISPYVFIGRGRDFAWSLTSAGSQNEQQFLEQLCGPSGAAPTRSSTHHLYKRRCRAMQLFDAGLLGAGGGQPARELTGVHCERDARVQHRERPEPWRVDLGDVRRRPVRSRAGRGDLAADVLDRPRSRRPPAQSLASTSSAEIHPGWRRSRRVSRASA